MIRIHTPGWLMLGGLALAFVVGCSSSVENDPGTSGTGSTGGAGGSGGTGTGGAGSGGGGMGGGGAGGGEPSDPVLVRVKISAFTGDESSLVDSASHPELFELDPRVATVSLSSVNPAFELKSSNGAARFLPSMTPAYPPDPAGHIDITITPASGSIDYTSVTYTTVARYANNPSSFRLQTNVDGFASTVSTIPLDEERTETKALALDPVQGAFTLRWEAHTDFGDLGGGEAGFATNDLVIRAAAE